MNRKLGPILLIGSLVLILVFVVGIRYGQRVEKTNKIINYLISLPPSPTPAPTLPPIKFDIFQNKNCGFKFLYPSTLKKNLESSYSAQLADKTQGIKFSCDQAEEIISTLQDIQATSQEGIFQNKKNFKTTAFIIAKSLYPLLEKSLEFLP